MSHASWIYEENRRLHDELAAAQAERDALRDEILNIGERLEVASDLHKAEVARLKVYENLDQNYVVCEGCERHTLPRDMRPDGDCYFCTSCGEIDKLKAIEQAARAADEACLKGSNDFPEKMLALRDALKENTDAK